MLISSHGIFRERLREQLQQRMHHLKDKIQLESHRKVKEK